MKLTSIKINKSYNADIKLNPMPKNCYECPFFHQPNPDDEDTWYEHWDCYLCTINDCTGIALERYKDCPL